jgi:hypothetical protein
LGAYLAILSAWRKEEMKIEKHEVGMGQTISIAQENPVAVCHAADEARLLWLAEEELLLQAQHLKGLLLLEANGQELDCREYRSRQKAWRRQS